MSDFLVAFRKPGAAGDLLRLLHLPHGESSRPGKAVDYGWGGLAVLNGPSAAGNSLLECEKKQIFAAVGDFLTRGQTALARSLFAFVNDFRAQPSLGDTLAKAGATFEQLNGAFAILLADEDGAAVITDPLASVQIYAGWDRKGRLSAIGTHADLVAVVAGEDYEIDPVAVFEFLAAGTPCFPHTMHARVRELAPGRVHVVTRRESEELAITDACWWPFPEEVHSGLDVRETAENLGEAFIAAVSERCEAAPVGVTLSGGLDSRLVMAAVPQSMPCIGLTFCDAINREARIARRVARCYGREWVPLFRDKDYVARTALETIRFIGCEGDWVNAHGVGFAEDIGQRGLRTVLTGLLMNNNVKGYYAADVRRVARGGGLLPALHEMVPYDYVGELRPCPTGRFADGLLEVARMRRRAFLEGHPGLRRESVAEWLDGYPFSQAPDNTAWMAERRLMPVRLPAMDRRLLEIACRIPMRAKAGGQLFMKMAPKVLGMGARIPDANDGVRPGSGHVSRLAQRTIRKMQNKGREALGRLGLKPAVPHSWHDYQRYWRESGMLGQLIHEHGSQLKVFEGLVFQGDSAKLLADKSLPWEFGFRLLQLALWKSVLSGYRAHANLC